MEISEKSKSVSALKLSRAVDEHTLCIQEVADGDRVGLVGVEAGVLEHLVQVVALRAKAHVLLAEMADMVVDVGVRLLKPSVAFFIVF